MAYTPRFDITDCTKVVKFGLLLSIISVPGKILDADTTIWNKTKITIQIWQSLKDKWNLHLKCMSWDNSEQAKYNIVLCNVKFSDKEW